MAETESETPKKPISIYDVLTILIEQMSALSWQKLGLHKDPVTGTTEIDLVEAKVAIDVTAQLVQHLESQLDEDDKRRIHSLVRDLRINYVQKSQSRIQLKDGKKGLGAVEIASQVLGQIVGSNKPQPKPSADVVHSDRSVPERLRELIDFHEQYENLVEALCDAARFGPDIVLERRYFEARTKIQADYPSLRPFLISYLEIQPEDAEAGLKLCGRPLDAFEALVAAFDLQEFFELDDGNMISRITRTREALNCYGEHLRQLAARVP